MFGGSLSERFVKASSTEVGSETEGEAPHTVATAEESKDAEAMTVDETDADKENVPKS